jgi:hypothetical protein
MMVILRNATYALKMISTFLFSKVGYVNVTQITGKNHNNMLIRLKYKVRKISCCMLFISRNYYLFIYCFH